MRFMILCSRYASNKDYLTTDDLLIFLESEQGVSYVYLFNVYFIATQFTTLDC